MANPSEFALIDAGRGRTSLQPVDKLEELQRKAELLSKRLPVPSFRFCAMSAS